MSAIATSKYYPLQEFLRQSGEDEIALSFGKIEEILGVSLPATARAQRAWWSNRSSGAVQANAWMLAGYHAEEVDVANERVTFRRPGLVYEVRRIDGEPVWDASLVKALRHHLAMTQAEFSQQLGVRQSTISEWETGVYEPRGASTKILSVVAEQAQFPYTA
ncbi:MAG: helix-turn-helix domain-containing protein [Caldilineaceae bacterium]|nr:helix-turn-helix domain-containing protein [Caldilineaceae bacterium]